MYIDIKYARARACGCMCVHVCVCACVGIFVVIISWNVPRSEKKKITINYIKLNTRGKQGMYGANT